ncbi:sugar transferase [Streptococcus tangpeifui]|uniref:sugar transferase n=1 Tax=Streptococcus tangpeifui TaxID=2709400 RepID=UPI0013EDC02A|nr:sugar transferase [Streptococcus sp. ZJ1593]
MTKKYLLDFIRDDTNTAASKAERDISSFLKTMGFLGINYDMSLPRAVKILGEDYILAKKIKGIQADDICFLQYSMFGRPSLKKLFKKLAFNRHKILLIHDIETLREQKGASEIAEELALLQEAQCLIVHNDQMANWLRNQELEVPMISLEVFDYAQPVDLPEKSVQNWKTVVFAGNLDKSGFLRELHTQTPFYLYGLKSDAQPYSENLTYCGSKTSTEIPSMISQYGFGLVWDGPAVDSCQGPFGDYMRYNNPHKVSLYLSTNLPVIIWKEAALAPFIEEHGLGLTLDSLADLDNRLAQLSQGDYDQMKANCKSMGKQLRNGYYTIKAAQAAVEVVIQ